MRILERHVVVPALRAAAQRPNGFISTAALIDELEAEFQPTGQDAVILDGRQDTRFSQIVRNLVSHRSSSTSMFQRGYAEYVDQANGIRITAAGRAFLDQVPE